MIDHWSPFLESLEIILHHASCITLPCFGAPIVTYGFAFMQDKTKMGLVVGLAVAEGREAIIKIEATTCLAEALGAALDPGSETEIWV